MIEYDSLPELWASLVDALSGRTSVIADPPILTGDWPPASGSFSVVEVDGADLSVTIETPTGTEELRCPAPAQTMAGQRSVSVDARYRRCQVQSFGANYFTGGGSNGHAIGVRSNINFALWEDLSIGSAYVPSVQLFTQNYRLGCSMQFEILASTEVAYSAGPVAGTRTLDSAIDCIVDLVVCVSLGIEDPGVNQPMTPAVPDDQEIVAAMFQYPGSGEILYGGQQIASVNALADALATSAGAAGALRTHWDRKLVSVTSETTVLPPATGTSDDALGRLAAGVRAAFGGDFVLNIKKPRAQVAGRRGVVVIG